MECFQRLCAGSFVQACLRIRLVGTFTFFLVQDPIPVFRNHESQTFSKRYFGFPVEELLCFGDVQFPFVRIISRVRFEFYGGTGVNCFLNNLCTWKDD